MAEKYDIRKKKFEKAREKMNKMSYDEQNELFAKFIKENNCNVKKETEDGKH